MKTNLFCLFPLIAGLLIISMSSGCRTASVRATASSGVIASTSEFDGINSAAESAPIWRYSENVEFADTHDPSVVALRDGRHFTVGYGEITTDEAFSWRAGRRLRLEYHPDSGACLVDVMSSRRLPLRGWPADGHPIDLRLQQLLTKNESTVGMMMAYDQAGHWWGVEVERAYANVAAGAETAPAARVALHDAAEQWQSFKAAHDKAVGEFYGSREGSIWKVTSAVHSYRLQKTQATLVWGMLGF